MTTPFPQPSHDLLQYSQPDEVPLELLSSQIKLYFLRTICNKGFLYQFPSGFPPVLGTGKELIVFFREPSCEQTFRRHESGTVTLTQDSIFRALSVCKRGYQAIADG
jgi:hypothetical protein